VLIAAQFFRSGQDRHQPTEAGQRGDRLGQHGAREQQAKLETITVTTGMRALGPRSETTAEIWSILTICRSVTRVWFQTRPVNTARGDRPHQTPHSGRRSLMMTPYNWGHLFEKAKWRAHTRASSSL
jgi:hypothetical protein